MLFRCKQRVPNYGSISCHSIADNAYTTVVAFLVIQLQTTFTQREIASPCNSNGPLVHLLGNEIVTCYREQAVKDWETFLLHRTKELVPGQIQIYFQFHTQFTFSFSVCLYTIFTPLSSEAYLHRRHVSSLILQMAWWQVKI